MTLFRRLLRYLVCVALLAGCAYVAAPALSTQRYQPGAVDFEQELPPLARVAGDGAGRMLYRTAPIAAPKRFDLAGIAGEMRPVRMRARLDGGEWTPWTESADGNPVYFGGADELQVKARGWRPAGTLHYVNVSGTTTTSSSLLTGAREAINSAVISVAATVEPAADAAPTRPEIITRSEWGADLKQGGCHPRAKPQYGEVDAAVVHHTVTAVDYSEAEAPEIVLGICRYHRNGNGWNDIGYQALIDRFGNVYTGRAGGIRKPVVGAQAQGFNAQTTAVASIGTHTKLPLTAVEESAFVDYLAWRLAAAGLQAIGKTTLVSAGGELSRYPKGRHVRVGHIFGHRTVGLTACPGDAMNAQVSQLKRRVQAAIEAAGGVEHPPSDGGPTGGIGRG